MGIHKFNIGFSIIIVTNDRAKGEEDNGNSDKVRCPITTWLASEFCVRIMPLLSPLSYKPAKIMINAERGEEDGILFSTLLAFFTDGYVYNHFGRNDHFSHSTYPICISSSF